MCRILSTWPLQPGIIKQPIILGQKMELVPGLSQLMGQPTDQAFRNYINYVFFFHFNLLLKFFLIKCCYSHLDDGKPTSILKHKACLCDSIKTLIQIKYGDNNSLNINNTDLLMKNPCYVMSENSIQII